MTIFAQRNPSKGLAQPNDIFSCFAKKIKLKVLLSLTHKVFDLYQKQMKQKTFDAISRLDAGERKNK